MSEESKKRLNRRKFITLTGGALAAAGLLAACGDNTVAPASATTAAGAGATTTAAGAGATTAAAGGTATTAAATGATTAAGAATAAGTNTSGVTIEYWSWVLGSKESVDLWNRTHTNFKVNYTQTTSGTPHYNKVKAAVAAGSGGPDLAQIEFQLVTSLVVGGALQPITQEAAPYKAKFIDWTIQQVTLGNDIYAIPQDIGPMGLFYRKDIFDQYSLAVPKTWEEYKAAAEKLHAADPTKYIASFSPAQPGQFAGFAWSNKAKWFGTKGDAWQVTINSAETKKVADYWQDLITRKLVKVEADFNPAWYKDLLDGNIATWVGAVWGAGTLATNAAGASGKWAVAYLPQWTAGSKVSGNWGGSTVAVIKGSKHVKEAVEFGAWLNSDPGPVGEMIKGNNIYPATKDGGSLPVLKQPNPYFSGQVINDIFTESAGNVDPSWTWGPTIDQVYADIGDQFTASTNGSGTLSSALDQAQAKTVADLKSKGLQVTQ
ncbi:MAG: putative solute-binding lipoprotein [Chloroflexi bacterium]|nr:putative solute-binding lipoprotein [Chloroflexota bacterium]